MRTGERGPNGLRDGRESGGDVDLGLSEADNPTGLHRMEMNHERDGDCSNWQHVRHQLGGDGETGATEEATRGVISVVRGTEVKVRVVGAVCGTEGEARVTVVVHGAGEVVEAVRQAGRPSASIWAVRPPGGTV
jgi:hypothetical protein